MKKYILFSLLILALIFSGCSKTSEAVKTSSNDSSAIEVTNDENPSEFIVEIEDNKIATTNLQSSLDELYQSSLEIEDNRIASIEPQFSLDELNQASLEIEGMTCGGCAVGIEYTLKEMDGVVDAFISYEDGKGEVIYNPKLVSKNDIINASEPYTCNILKVSKATSYSINKST